MITRQFKFYIKSNDLCKFAIIKRALKVLGRMPVTSCTCERSFSLRRLLKTYFQTTMAYNPLNALALLRVHPNIYPSSEEVLQTYVAFGPDKIELE